ncbi:MAG: GNAT family N-acetyltransferase [Oricola sp.]
MGDITIRQARMEDAERLNAALRHLSRDIGDDHGATAAMLREAGFGANPAFRALLAEADGDVVGATLYSPVFSTVRAGAGVYVSDLWVLEAMRGTGLGRRLLTAVAADAEMVWNACFLKLAVYDDNRQARAFYDRLGFADSPDETILVLDRAGLAALKDGK